jgi:hypothetical protein
MTQVLYTQVGNECAGAPLTHALEQFSTWFRRTCATTKLSLFPTKTVGLPMYLFPLVT